MCENPLDRIEHVVVLMLENRTFDNVLGMYMQGRYDVGVPRSKWDPDTRNLHWYSAKYDGVEYPVWFNDEANPQSYTDANLSIPEHDPPELFANLNYCMYEKNDPGPEDAQSQRGFVEAWVGAGGKVDPKTRRADNMHIYQPKQFPVLTALADNFGVCDCWFSSAPTQTWANRNFLHAGTSFGYTDNLPIESDREEDTLNRKGLQKFNLLKRFNQFNSETLFGRLVDAGREFRVYYDFPSPLCILLKDFRTQMFQDRSRMKLMADFAEDVEKGNLPEYTFVEPRYNAYGNHLPNDMHPPHNVSEGEALIAEVYNRLRANEKLWANTMLIVTFDEGVGLFDHVKPPKAVDPAPPGKPYQTFGQKQYKSNPFERYGTRVGCVVASPFIPKGTVIRPKDPESPPFDHTSIIKTVQELFVVNSANSKGIYKPLTLRDKHAPSLVPHLSPNGTNMGPKELRALAYPKSAEFIARVIKEQKDAHARAKCHSALKLYSLFHTLYGLQGRASWFSMPETYEKVSSAASTSVNGQQMPTLSEELELRSSASKSGGGKSPSVSALSGGDQMISPAVRNFTLNNSELLDGRRSGAILKSEADFSKDMAAMMQLIKKGQKKNGDVAPRLHALPDGTSWQDQQARQSGPPAPASAPAGLASLQAQLSYLAQQKAMVKNPVAEEAEIVH